MRESTEAALILRISADRFRSLSRYLEATAHAIERASNEESMTDASWARETVSAVVSEVGGHLMDMSLLLMRHEPEGDRE